MPNTRKASGHYHGLYELVAQARREVLCARRDGST
jgi:hypothetical protein